MNHSNILRYTRFQILFPTQRHSAFCGDRTNRSAPGPGLAPSMEGVGIPSYPSKRNRCPNRAHTRAELAKTGIPNRLQKVSTEFGNSRAVPCSCPAL